jgi:hypothetical protein
MGSLLKNKFLFLFLFGLIVFTTQCSLPEEKKKEETKSADSASCRKKPVNPNGDSELALLMRDMKKLSDTLKEQILAGELNGNFPERLRKIHTATPTDADTKHESFNSYARNYIYNMEELYRSPKAGLKKKYNATVDACLSCHSDHCPGPIPTIEKLKIAE